MKKQRIVLTAGCMCASVVIAGTSPIQAATKVELDSAVAGMSVAMNNFYAGSLKPEEELKNYLLNAVATTETPQAAAVEEEAVMTAVPEEAPAEEVSPYANVAVSRVGDDENYVNIRTDANTDAEIVGKIYNNCAATIEEEVASEDGTWYKISSGSVEGYIKSDYFVTGDEAEAVAMEIGKSYAEVTEGGLRLREDATTDSEVIDTLWLGDTYTVVDKTDDFVKLSLGKDDDGNEITGYVASDYVDTYVKFDTAISIEEEEAKIAEQKRLEEEAKAAEEALEKAKEEAKKEAEKEKETQKQETKAETKAETAAPAAAAPAATAAPATAAPTTAAPATAAPTTAAPTTAAPTAAETTVANATRAAIVAYAKQFIGCPYVYGGNSLTGGTDCSGFTKGVYAHFGISLPRSSKAQGNAGRQISVSQLQPGDLVFWANGGSIYHVMMYIGNGQILHARDEAHGICIDYFDPNRVYKAISLL